MNSTGIVRRMDDLGRLVIPKEIRNAIGAKEGDPFEISVDIENQTVNFHRYTEDYIAEIEAVAKNVINNYNFKDVNKKMKVHSLFVQIVDILDGIEKAEEN